LGGVEGEVKVEPRRSQQERENKGKKHRVRYLARWFLFNYQKDLEIE